MCAQCPHSADKNNPITNTVLKVVDAMDPIAIYEDLKEKIIWLDLEPESTLNLVELAESYGVRRNHHT